MSDEEWNRRAKAAEERRQKEEAKVETELNERRATAKEAAIKVLTPYLAMVKRQREYLPQLTKKLKAYHEKPAGDDTPAGEWNAAYAEVGRLMAAALVSFHFQADEERGCVQGPGETKFWDAEMRVDMPDSPTLEAYLGNRNIPFSDDELKYFKSLVARKVDLPIFLVATAEDNLQRIVNAGDPLLAAPEALLEFVVEDDLIREEMVEVFLDPKAEF